MGNLFNETISKARHQVEQIEKADVIIGIPFYNDEEETLRKVVSIALDSLQTQQLQKLVVCAGDPAGGLALNKLMEEYKDVPVATFLMPRGINGKGWSIRAIFELARLYEADVILLEAGLDSRENMGLKPEWIDRLARPILDEYDMAIASFRRHPFEDMAGAMMVSPFISALYGIKLSDPISGVFSISHDLVEDFCAEFDQCREVVGGYGIDPWLVTTALRWGKRICEVQLGPKLTRATSSEKKMVFKQIAGTLFECINRDEEIWLKQKPAVRTPDVIGRESAEPPTEIICNFMDFLESFREGFFNYRDFLCGILSRESIELLEGFLNNSLYKIESSAWAKMAYEFLLAYNFRRDVEKEKILECAATVFDGVSACFLKEMTALEKVVARSGLDEERVMAARARDIFDEHRRAFMDGRAEFTERWVQKAEKTRPVLTPLDYLEFIPGVPIILPKKLKGADKREVFTGNIFKRLQKKYEVSFKNFLQMINIDSNAPSGEIARNYAKFMAQLEKTVDSLYPGDLYTEEGTMNMITKLFDIFPHKRITVVKWEILRKLLYEFPPRNLIIRMGFRNMRQLLDNMEVRDILTLAQFTEDKDYFDRIFHWLKDNLRPDSFEEVELSGMVVSRNKFPALNELREISDLNRLTARIAVMNLGKGMGGDYPKLRYFTRIAKSIVEAEHFSELWKTYARERKEVGRKFVNSILGHYGKAMFSAHHIFENWHHRQLTARLKKLASSLAEENRPEDASRIAAMAAGYGLSLVLEDGTFLPCSAWTWAGYSFKGGEGVPTPLSLHIERDWFNHDLLEELYKEMGYNPAEIMEQVFQLISQGRESSDLSVVLLGVKPPREEIVIQELENWPKARMLKRFSRNPILSPIKDHWWESKYVLNTAALRVKDRVYLLYRAFGQDEVSRIGLAISDGYNIIERLDKPVFVPETEQERKGCEDPRVVIIEDEIFMLYTAYDGVVAQIAAASIPVKDFLNRDFDRWKRRGLAFPGLWDKDAFLFPEKIEGKYVIYHRIEPSIWISYSNELVFPWPKNGHKIIMGPRSGLMWDSLKIGAGAQPIKTKYGWLLIYHGVDREMLYRLGVILVDLKDPGRLLYRSPNPILSPETDCEIGKKGECWVPNVVFTCGAVPALDKEVLDDDDEILVYYGAADTNICLATGKVEDLIPEEVRQRLARYNY
ncbi:MAG TPA: glycosidase [Thermoanaerobacterales bacterium]|nr:glycosidase [Thermoanaerobacterales bacterium]